MVNFYPIAAVDVETAKFYSQDEMTKMKLESLLCDDKLSDIVSLAIVWIDEN